MQKKIKAIKRLGETSLLFSSGVFLDCLTHATSALPEDSALLGLSPHIFGGIMTISSHVIAHGIFEGWKEGKEALKRNKNSHLEQAVINAYRNSFEEIRNEIINENNLVETGKDSIFRYFFRKENSNHLAQLSLDEEFLQPLLESLSNNNAIEKMFSENAQLHPDDYLLQLIKEATPSFYTESNTVLKSFIIAFLEKFKRQYKKNFLQELKADGKAKTAYHTHLLESILNRIDKIDELSKKTEEIYILLWQFSKETGVSLFRINENLSTIITGLKELKTIIENKKVSEDLQKKRDFIFLPIQINTLNSPNSFEKFFESDKTIDELKKSYNEYEERVKTRLITIFSKEIPFMNYPFDEHFIDSQTYKMELFSNPKVKKQQLLIKINSVGKIRKLLIVIPESIALKINFDMVGKKLEDCILSEYEYFRKTLLEKVHIYESVLTEKLYDMVAQALTHNIDKTFIGKYYLTITQIVNKTETKCIYSLNSEALRRLLDILKLENSNSDRSIIERMLDFISIQMIDVILPMTRFEKSYLAELEKFTLDVQSQLMKDYFKILEVEKAFYKSQYALVFIDKLVECDSFIVEINADGLLKDYFEKLKENKEFQEAIKRKFVENVTKFLSQYNEYSILTQIFRSDIVIVNGPR